jgi:hypothetical protein
MMEHAGKLWEIFFVSWKVVNIIHDWRNTSYRPITVAQLHIQASKERGGPCSKGFEKWDIY